MTHVIASCMTHSWCVVCHLVDPNETEECAGDKLTYEQLLVENRMLREALKSHLKKGCRV
jgi:hypothetical protein